MKTSVVWNPTRSCVWDCAFCCLNCHKISEPNQVNVKREKEFSFPGELNFHEKKEIIDQFTPEEFTLDFGGGELFMDPLNLELVLYASDRLGAENVSISKSGSHFTDAIAEQLSGKIQDIEISLDYVPNKEFSLRPKGYHLANARAIVTSIRYNIFTGVQTVLTKENILPEKLRDLYGWLCENGVHKWSLLRFFPVGRGARFQSVMPTYDEYCRAVEYVRSFSEEGGPEIHFQYLLPNHDNYTLNCRAVKKSIGVLHNGIVTSCFWALTEEMHPTDNKFILGQLPKDNIHSILSNSKAQYWLQNNHTCPLFQGE